MAARWGAGEETLTIGGMELFTTGGPLQCQAFEDDEACTGLSDLSLSSLDAGGILGTFQGYIDHSIISIIDDPGTQAQNKSNFDEDNELSLLTALTEILDNADDENMSPFDTIPDTELLVSPKDRDSSALQKLLSLSRTPPEREMSLIDDQRRSNSGKVDRSSGLNWEQFSEGISSTPKRHSRHKIVRGCMPRRTRKGATQQRSDGEEEEVNSPEKKSEVVQDLAPFDSDFSMDSSAKKNEFEQEMGLKLNTPCIINTENVALNDLVKYMHPYCLPAITGCLDPDVIEMDEDIEDAIFLEIVSEEGDCIKLPVRMEHPEEVFLTESDNLSALHSVEQFDSEVKIQSTITGESQEEQCVPVHKISFDGHFEKLPDELEFPEKTLNRDKESLTLPSFETDREKHSLDSLQEVEVLEKEIKDLPELDGFSTPTVCKENVAKSFDQKLEQLSLEKPKETDYIEQNSCVQEVSVKRKRDKKDGQSVSSKLKVKAKNKNVTEDKEPVVAEKTLQKITPPPPSKRPSNNLLQESDFLIKQLDQVKRDSQMELRSSKTMKTRGRTRVENSLSLEKKTLNESVKKAEKNSTGKEFQSASENVDAGTASAHKNLKVHEVTSDQSQDKTTPKDDCAQKESTALDEVSMTATSDVQVEDCSTIEENNPNVEEQKEESNQLTKEVKPKSLSLSEYRKRLQHRKPNAEERENENASGSKWPSIPEPPTELAEIPCLIVPGKDVASKTPKQMSSVEELPCPTNMPEEPQSLDVPNNLDSAPPAVALPPVTTQETLPLNQTEIKCPTVVDTHTFPVHPNIPPPFYPPAWPVPSPATYYPTVPTLPAPPAFPNCIPHDPLHVMPVHPPVMTWPPFPPPPIAVGTVNPSDPSIWAPMFQPPYWQPPSVPQSIPEVTPVQPFPESISTSTSQVTLNSAYSHVHPDVKVSPDTAGAFQACKKSGVPTCQVNKSLVHESGMAFSVSKEKLEDNKPTIENLKQNTIKLQEKKITIQGKPPFYEIQKPNHLSPVKPAENNLPKVPPVPIKTMPVPDLKSANQVVFKIMELLKNAQRRGVQAIPPSTGPAKDAPLQSQNTISSGTLEPAGFEKSDQLVTAPSLTEFKPSVASAPEMPLNAAVPAVESKSPERVSIGNPSMTQVLEPEHEKRAQIAEGCMLLTPQEEGDPKETMESFACEKGIEATDLTSLLEQFEQSEAKDEHMAQNHDLKVAVGNSGSEKPSEKKIHDRLLAPELVNTAGLTPPATPPHQLWKPINAGALCGKPKPLHANLQEKTCASPIKTTKLIEAKPLPQSKLRNRNPVAPSNKVSPPVHVASGDHDYCILSALQVNTCSNLAQPKPESNVPPSRCEEGSRWNVKHHQNILIKPIVAFNKGPLNKACQKPPGSTQPSSLPSLSAHCSAARSTLPCNAVTNDVGHPLDHRTNDALEAVERHPDSVLMSPDSSPCRSDSGNTAAEAKKETLRSRRCYRKYKSSPSPEKTSCRGRKSSVGHSCSSRSSSLSSSRSRSRSPPSKRRRKYSSRSSDRSRSSSSSRSISSTSSISRSSSCSSRSRSPCSSRSRSRARSGSQCRKRCRSRRYESQKSYNRQRMLHKERAIEERRVVYIGKINNRMTRSELKDRFSVFGEIEECTIHFREHGDNYGFVTYRHTKEAFDAIENGYKLRLPDELPFDLCFGGRRQFCKSNYADLDSNCDGFDPGSTKSKSEAVDFDTLLKLAQKNIRR